MAILSPLKEGLCDPFVIPFMHTLGARVILLMCPAVKQYHIHSAAGDLTRPAQMKVTFISSQRGNNRNDAAAKLTAANHAVLR